MEKLKTSDPGYWRDWYWNRGGREKVQARRKINEYKRYTLLTSNKQSNEERHV